MRMSNLFADERLEKPVMAASQQPVGIAHLTVVPANFDREEATGEEDAEPDEQSQPES